MALCTGLLLFVFASICYAAPGRIVGGDPTTIENYTSMAQVEFAGILEGLWGQNCACSILNTRHVLSAAHCFEGVFYAPSHRRIRAGATYRNTGGILSAVEQAFNHPTYSYGQSSFDGDISVVRLIQPLVYSPVVQQATIIAQGFTIPDNLPVIHAGWGSTVFGGQPSNQLQDVTVYTISNELCRQRYAQAYLPVTENMICAGVLDVGGKNACGEDTGGPLYFQNIVIGIVSWSIGCAHEFYPGVSTAVASYSDWIVNIAQS